MFEDNEQPTHDSIVKEDRFAGDIRDEPENLSGRETLSFEERFTILETAVNRQSLHREIHYKTLMICQECRSLGYLEDEIASYPEFRHATLDQYHLIDALVQAGGLRRIELDREGIPLTPERTVDLSAEEIEDLIVSCEFETIDVGTAFVTYYSPYERIQELFEDIPERYNTYIELMDFCAEEPRTYTEIEELLNNQTALTQEMRFMQQPVQPSVFVDKLEGAAGIIWNGGWILTDEGRKILQKSKQLQERETR